MFQIGAAYSRQKDIHERLGGQRQSGISTPRNSEFIFLFTGEAGAKHGYLDEVTEEGFRLYGEGQTGDMTFTRGNLALRDHRANHKRLLLFQAMGKGESCIFRGEYMLLRHEVRDGVPDTMGKPRKAIVFVLEHTESDKQALESRADFELPVSQISVEDTARLSTREIRTKQVLFRERVERVERGCRITGITDGRFLRASHIRPWAECDGDARVDGHNGLLLAPHIDHLFDGGWLSFSDFGRPLVSSCLPKLVVQALGIKPDALSRAQPFTDRQIFYLHYHRREIFRGTR